MDLNFQLLAESLPHLVWSALADGNTVYCNRRFLNYFDTSLDEIVGWNWLGSSQKTDCKVR